MLSISLKAAIKIVFLLLAEIWVFIHFLVIKDKRADAMKKNKRSK